MARRRWIQDKNGKLVEVLPNSKPSSSKGFYIGGKNSWARTTKVEFSQTTIDQDIADRNKR